MGARAECCIQFGDQGNVWLYGHWWGEGWPITVWRALRRRQRWDDGHYLARIIISEAVKEAGIDEETGLGISPMEYDSDSYETTYVDLVAKTVQVGAFWWSFEDFVQHMEKQSGPATAPDPEPKTGEAVAP